jgi:Family of unknown function (DUF6491)
MRTARSAVLAGFMLAATAAWSYAAEDPAPAPAAAPSDVRAPEARIPFAKTNLWNWQVVDDKTVLIQDQSRRWYKATLFGTCTNLGFANRIAFDSNPGGTFDKFSALIVRGQRCPLSSLVKTDPPAKKAKAVKPAPAPASQ